MYVDESGDPGVGKYASPHYILSGLIINSNDWRKYLDQIKTFRTAVKKMYGLNIREEIHAAELIRINKIKSYAAIRKADRIHILRNLAVQIPVIFNTAKVVNVCLRKADFPADTDFQKLAWSRLITRYDVYLKKSVKDNGIIIADDSSEGTIRSLLRKLRTYNPIMSHFNGETYNAPTDNIIEDVFHRDSAHSYYIQIADVIAHLLYRKEYPKGSLKKYGVHLYFDELKDILLKEASKKDAMGVVRN
ncbi:DUF3800 domain-containing protein [Chitinophaga agrisoli]|nr:DUF3800 domain-containing protein [Chitinophaga agrisoli]